MMTSPSNVQIVNHQAGKSSKPELQKEPDVMVVGTVHAPIEQVWKLFRPFGPEIMKWWPIYAWVELEPPGVDEVGAVRNFKANGFTYQERLVLRDDTTYTEQYAYVSSDAPVPIKSALTTIQLVQKGPLETEVRWSSNTEVNPLFLPLVKSTQRGAYHGAIESLARYFNPVTEILEVKVVGAEIPLTGILGPSTYVVVQIEGAPPQRTGLRHLTTRPKWNESVQFNVGVLDRKVRLSVWDARIGRDNLIGTATIGFDKLTNGEAVQQTVQLEGPTTGKLTVSLRYRLEFEALRNAMNLAKTLGGGTIGRAVPLLGQLGFEIGMLDTTVANLEIAARTYLTQKLGFQLPRAVDPVANKAGLVLLDLRQAAAGVQVTIRGIAEQLIVLAQAVQQSIREGDLAVYEYARYPRLEQIPLVPLENLPRMVKGLPRQEILPPSKLGGMLQRGLEYAFSEFDLVERYRKAILSGNDPFEAFFSGWVKRVNPVVDHWKDDAEFCRQLIQGVDPLMIRMVRSPDEIPTLMQLLSAGGRSLEELIKEKRLFILDYVLLSKLKPYRNMVFYAPIVLVYRELLPDGESRLNLVGIQLTRDPGPNVVYTATTSPPNRYLYAKIQVACADNQYHQFIYHLGLAHLATEPMVIAHHNVFYKHPEHPIGKLLKPHLEQTLGINFLARQTLVTRPDVAVTDKTFAPGTAQALELFLLAWEQYDFFGNSFPEDLRVRGFDEEGTDGVQHYYFRDDGFKVWRALERYIGAVVDEFYHKSDEAVAADPVVQSWAKESSDPDRADIPGFPRAITSRALLVKTLTTIVFHASAFHSAVNFSQLQYLSYVPNRPDSTFAKMPLGEDDITMEFILGQAMPNFVVSNFQISFALLLTLPSDAPLSRVDAVAAEFPEAHKQLQEDLRSISKQIIARDLELEKAGKQPYPYLNPDQIASSVAI